MTTMTERNKVGHTESNLGSGVGFPCLELAGLLGFVLQNMVDVFHTKYPGPCRTLVAIDEVSTLYFRIQRSMF